MSTKSKPDKPSVYMKTDGSFEVDREALHNSEEYKRQVAALKELIEKGFIKTQPVYWG